MKKITLLIAILGLFFVSCENEIATETTNLETLKRRRELKVKAPKLIKECNVVNVDRCNDPRQPNSNFWWPSSPNAWFEGYFSTTTNHNLTFSEYDNGTAHIFGSVIKGDCVVQVDAWLKDKKSWTDWSANGGSYKKEGCSGGVAEDLSFYVIDAERSTITATGGDCLGEGTFGLEQRPDPFDPNTPNFGVHVGPGGANFDSNVGAPGLSGWGWITNEAGERLWVMDFNFRFECPDSCDTAFAKGTDEDSTCFIEDGFNRWGWTIGPLSEGNYTFDVYAGAGQCDTDKGELVGLVNVDYTGGSATVTYSITNDDYTLDETHLYIGSEPYPLKDGVPTVAPGHYGHQNDLDNASSDSYTVNDLSGDIYVIAHGVVCKE